MQVKEAMRADPNVRYESCSDVVGQAMAADVMRSVKYLIPDILSHIPVLLYQVRHVMSCHVMARHGTARCGMYNLQLASWPAGRAAQRALSPGVP
jgi:hypothetical protein